MKTIILILAISFQLSAQPSLLTLFDSEVVATPPADTLGVNILNNSTFEALFNEATDWGSLFGGAISRSTEQVQGGTYAAKVVSDGAGTGIQYYRDGNLLSVVEDSIYWVEGYYYIVTGDGRLKIETPLGNTAEFNTYNTWTYFKLQITATSTTDIYLRCAHAGGGASLTFYLDNLTVKRRL